MCSQSGLHLWLTPLAPYLLICYKEIAASFLLLLCFFPVCAAYYRSLRSVPAYRYMVMLVLVGII